MFKGLTSCNNLQPLSVCCVKTAQFNKIVVRTQRGGNSQISFLNGSTHSVKFYFPAEGNMNMEGRGASQLGIRSLAVPSQEAAVYRAL